MHETQELDRETDAELKTLLKTCTASARVHWRPWSARQRQTNIAVYLAGKNGGKVNRETVRAWCKAFGIYGQAWFNANLRREDALLRMFVEIRHDESPETQVVLTDVAGCMLYEAQRKIVTGASPAAQAEALSAAKAARKPPKSDATRADLVQALRDSPETRAAIKKALS